MSAVDDDDVDDQSDNEPFALGSAFAEGLAGLAGGEHARMGVEADRTRRFKLKVEAWAKKRGLAIIEGAIIAVVDEVNVSVALFEMTEETAVVRATARSPASVSVTVEPATRSWTDGLFGRFKKKSVTTGSQDFDEKFRIHTSDEPAMRQLVDETMREAILEMDAWCMLSYKEGKIEVRLDSARLAGAHVRRAIAIAAALARTQVQTSAYR